MWWKEFLCEVLERFFCDVEMKARLSCIIENVVDPVYGLYTMQRCTQNVEQTQESCIFQAAKLEEQSPLSSLTSDIVPEVWS